MARGRTRDFYAVLGVAKDADDAEIKRAFREQARRWHPDVNPDNPEAAAKFRELSEAYSTLSDRAERARYDRWGPRPDGLGPTGFAAAVAVVEELFGDVVRRRKPKERGRDLRYTLELSLVEAAFGGAHVIRVPNRADGADAGAREFTVSIPPGASDGSVKVLPGEGEAGRHGGAAGDLTVFIRVRDEPGLRRDGADVHGTLSLSFTEAALGAVVEVTTLDGVIKLRVPAGTQPGQVLRMPGRGIPLGPGVAKTDLSNRGDHVVTTQVRVPTDLTPAQREAIEALAQLLGERPLPQKRARGLLDRMRSLLDE